MTDRVAPLNPRNPRPPGRPGTVLPVAQQTLGVASRGAKIAVSLYALVLNPASTSRSFTPRSRVQGRTPDLPRTSADTPRLIGRPSGALLNFRVPLARRRSTNAVCRSNWGLRPLQKALQHSLDTTASRHCYGLVDLP